MDSTAAPAASWVVPSAWTAFVPCASGDGFEGALIVTVALSERLPRAQRRRAAGAVTALPTPCPSHAKNRASIGCCWLILQKRSPTAPPSTSAGPDPVLAFMPLRGIAFLLDRHGVPWAAPSPYRPLRALSAGTSRPSSIDGSSWRLSMSRERTRLVTSLITSLNASEIAPVIRRSSLS